MSNPHLPPSFDPKHFQDQAYAPPPNYAAYGGYGWVSQIRVVAVLNCVQGGLEVFLGLTLVAVGFGVPYLIEMEAASNPNAQPPPPEMKWVLTIVYGGLGGLLLIAGLLRFYAGIRNFFFRGRVLGIVSFSTGMISMFACYCAPTSIAMLVYGLVVYLNPAVKAAFEMGEQGMSVDQILPSFAAPNYAAPPPGQLPK